MNDLRQRLQARRERIAAGLPPPDPVTMTPAFFTSAMTTTKPRVCTHCKTSFMPMGKESLCGPCRDKRDDERKRLAAMMAEAGQRRKECAA